MTLGIQCVNLFSGDNEDEDLSLKGLISTSPTSLKPDRDDSFGSVLASTQSTIRYRQLKCYLTSLSISYHNF